MNLKTWYTKRGSKFIFQRGKIILERQGLTAEKAINRVEQCVDSLARLNCAPTFPTPGDIVRRYPKFIQHLQEKDVEIAVHSYHHKNLSELPITLAKQQLERAIGTFEKYGIEVHGFRCPYLGFSTELIESIPIGLFKYSSNEPIFWEPCINHSNGNHFYHTLNNFYLGRNATETVCMPYMKANLIEIPVCVPDDLQLYDGLCLNPDEIYNEWKIIQNSIYCRGELFNLLFHPELATYCNNPFILLLNYIRNSKPHVWVARLRDISEWWHEKSNFSISSHEHLKELTLKFNSTSRATILAKDLNNVSPKELWYGDYYRILSNQITIPAYPRPFIGLTHDISDSITSFLIEQGYILDLSEKANQCSIFLDNKINILYSSNLKLIEFIESFSGPLIRYWRWPNGARSALSITGDLDALSIMDYAARIFY